MIWLLLDATSTTQQFAPPDWAGWATLLLGPYPLTAYLLYRVQCQDRRIDQLTEAARQTGEKTLDALLRTQK